MATEESLNQIAGKIFALPYLNATAEHKAKIVNLIKTTVNGDNIVADLAVSGGVRPGVMGVLAYILTNRRILKFDIDTQDIKSVSFPIDTITGVERTLEANRAGVTLAFQNSGTFGIKYTQPNPQIEEFFQKVDQARAAKAAGA